MGCPIHPDTIYMGHSMTQAVSHWPLTTDIQVQSQATLYGISDGQSSSRQGPSPSTLVFHCQYHPTNSFIYQQYHTNLATFNHHYHHKQLLSFRSRNPLVLKLNSQCNLQVSPWTGRHKHVMTYLWST